MQTKFYIAILLLTMGFTKVSAQPQDKLKELTTHIQFLINQNNWVRAGAVIDDFYQKYPTNPTELDMVEKYEVDKLNEVVKTARLKEEQVYNDIKSYRVIKDCETYMNDFPYGRYRREVRAILDEETDDMHWEIATVRNTIADYKRYLNQHAGGKHIEDAKNRIIELDRIGYDIAIAGGTANDYRLYLSRYPEGIFRTEISNKLELKIEEDMYKKARLSNKIEDYETYIREYPFGIYADHVNQIIENSYMAFGKKAYKNGNWRDARSDFNKYLRHYPSGRYKEEAEKYVKKCSRKLSQSGTGFLMYTYDEVSPLGLSFGSLSVRSVSVYYTIKLNQDIFKGYDVLYEIDEQGKSDSPRDILPTGEIVDANIAMSLGLTRKLVYPLWAYAGAGVGYYAIYHEVEQFNSNGTPYETVWMKSTESPEFEFFPEGGLMLKLGGALVCKYGISYQNGVIHQFGVGFQF